MIHVIDNWYIDSDECNYILGKLVTRVDKEGIEKQTLANTSYHNTVNQALNSLLRRFQRKLVHENMYELKQAIDAFESVEAYFNSIFIEIVNRK